MTITTSSYLSGIDVVGDQPAQNAAAAVSEHVQRAEAMLADDRAVPAVPAPSNAT